MTDKCFFPPPFLSAAQNCLAQARGRNMDIRRIVANLLFFQGEGITPLGRKRNASPGLFLFCKELRGFLRIFLQADDEWL